MKTDWREWIKEEGIKDVSDRIGMSYETVRAWVADDVVPIDKHKIALVRVSDGELNITDFF